MINLFEPIFKSVQLIKKFFVNPEHKKYSQIQVTCLSLLRNPFLVMDAPKRSDVCHYQH